MTADQDAAKARREAEFSRTPLARKLAERIAAAGPVSIHDYMAACLYDPEHGYYRTATAIGQGGDFVTAPEISQVFGEMAGVWLAETWSRMGKPDPFHLVELGPGRGTLMADMVRLLRAVPGLLAASRVTLVETSEALAERQRQALRDVPVPVAWAREIADIPPGPAIVIANEVLDCLPVRQFRYAADEAVWRERRVGLSAEGDRFETILGDVTEIGETLPVPWDGAILEIRPGVDEWLRLFADRAASEPFAALMLDYGHEETGYGDTLQAVRSQSYTGLFDAPGEADITAHVDFAHLRRSASRAGLATFGPMPMGRFLLKLGANERIGQLVRAASPEQARALMQGVARLVDPQQMGLLFKAIVVARGGMAPMPPFDAV